MSLMDIVDDKKPEKKKTKRKTFKTSKQPREEDFSDKEFSFNILTDPDPRTPMDCQECGNISFGVEGLDRYGSYMICSNPFCKNSIFNFCKRTIENYGEQEHYRNTACEELDLVEIQCAILDHKKRKVIA